MPHSLSLHASLQHHCAALPCSAASQITFQGAPPHELLKLLKDGPGKHTTVNAKRYHTKITKEIAHIQRIRECQLYGLSLIVSTFLSVMIAVFNYIASRIPGYDEV